MFGNLVVFGEFMDDILMSMGELVVGVGDWGKLGEIISFGNVDGNKVNNIDIIIVVENCRGR